MTFLVYGGQDKLERARETLLKAVLSEPSAGDQISRWVAAHLFNLSGDLEKNSVRSVLPPETHPGLIKAFAMGHPRVLTLWPPQIELLKPNQENEKSPLSREVKRMFLSTPTSSGKTLLAQLLIASHLSTQQTSVYYIAPTRSLCREVRVSLQARLRYLRREIADGLPEGAWLEYFLPSEPHVEVMTPERLSYLLRTDSGKVLSEVGLFIFDEVHNIDDPSRGWVLEQSLAYLHSATKDRDQRIVLLSAAVGNQAHFVQWMKGSDESFVHRPSEWRGPRRVHAIFTTSVDWDMGTLTSPKRKKKETPLRLTYPTFGNLFLRISQTGKSHPLKTDRPTGQLAFYATNDGKRESKESAHSTPFYKQLIPIINHLAKMGPVLVIESTRTATVDMARALAENQPQADQEYIKDLLDLIEARLGSQHPLREVIQKGVAYHHGSLPSEIRVAVEEAVTSGQIKYLVATTTMTEGVNLPVRSVVIAQQGANDEEEYKKYITGSKLVNAIGRAGRATKETEGIVVLALHSKFDENEFGQLAPNPEELKVYSMLATERALSQLAALEEAQRNLEDLVFEISEGTNSGFLSFVWFIAAELEKISSDFLTFERVSGVLSHTLGWVQLNDTDKTKWLKLAEAILTRYKATDESSRRRWAASGTSINSARKIEEIARSLANSAKKKPIPEAAPLDLVKYILAEGRLDELLVLPESPKKLIYTKRSGTNRPVVKISVDELLSDWMTGNELVDIANKHLGNVADIDFRFEQLGDLLNQYFEVYFPWVLGTLISWANQFLVADGMMNPFSQSAPAYVRWGVGSVPAVELMSKGLTSRTLATRIANSWLSAKTEETILYWLRSLSLAEWQKLFSASTTELRLLLEFCRDQRGGAAAELITNEKVVIAAQTELSDFPPSPVRLAPIDNSEVSHFGIWANERIVGRIGSKDHAEIQAIESFGLRYSAMFSVISSSGTLQLELISPED